MNQDLEAKSNHKNHKWRTKVHPIVKGYKIYISEQTRFHNLMQKAKSWLFVVRIQNFNRHSIIIFEGVPSLCLISSQNKTKVKQLLYTSRTSPEHVDTVIQTSQEEKN